MPEGAYEQILVLIQQLTLDEQLTLIADIVGLLRNRLGTDRPQHSILELRGLGKEVWEGVDVDQYLEQERNSWDE